MARTINFDFALGSDPVQQGRITMAGTHLTTAGDTIVLPPVRVEYLSEGAASIADVAPSPGDGTWRYQVKLEPDTGGAFYWIVDVPDLTTPVNFTDLPVTESVAMPIDQTGTQIESWMRSVRAQASAANGNSVSALQGVVDANVRIDELELAGVSDSGVAGLIDGVATETRTAVSGAVSATSGILNIVDFGAKVDGVTDDLDAIHAALAAANGRVVRCPAGVIRTRDSILLPTNGKLLGEGIDKTIIKLTDTAPAGAWVVTNATRGSGNQQLLVQDITLDWNVQRFGGAEPAAGGSRSSCLTFGNVQWGWAVRVKAINAGLHGIDVTCASIDYPYGGDGTWAAGPSRNIWIQECRIDGFGDDGITTHHSEYIYISDCESRGPRKRTNNNAFEVDDGSRFVFLTNNRSFNSFAGLEIKAHDDASAPYDIHINGHIDVGSCRAFNFRHIGHHTASDPDSLTAKNIFARDLVAIGPNNHLGFQDDATPRGLVVAAYHNVRIDGLQIVGDPTWQYTASDVAVALQFKCRRIKLTGVSVFGFEDAAADIYVTGGANKADEVQISGVTSRASAVRCIQVGTQVLNVSIRDVIATGGPGAIHGMDISPAEVVDIAGVNISGFTNTIRHDGVNYPSFETWQARTELIKGRTTIQSLNTPAQSYYLSTSTFASMTDRPARAAAGGYFLENGKTSGVSGSYTWRQTLTRNSTAAQPEQWVRIVINGGAAGEWERIGLTDGNTYHDGNPVTIASLNAPKSTYYLSTVQFDGTADKPAGATGAFWVENGPRSTSTGGEWNFRQTLVRNSLTSSQEMWSRIVRNTGVTGPWLRIY